MQTSNPKDPTSARAYWITARERGEIRTEALPALRDDEVLVAARFSGISRGTERLVFTDNVPESERDRMRAPFQAGSFSFPVKYGYVSVGRVLRGVRSLVGRDVFCLYPHQTSYVVPASAVLPLPDHVPAPRAVLAANMETAINGIWDAQIQVGDRVVIVGAGVVGCLLAYLAARIPGTQVTLVDIDARKAKVADAMGARFAYPHAAPRDADVLLHASGAPDGLATALELAAQEARVVEMSWYGKSNVTLPLGQSFHAKRLTIRSSQVGSIPPLQQARWTHARRLALALDLLGDDVLDWLVTSECPFETLPEAMAELASSDAFELCKRVVYE
jgi:2-desacetyl-2-hydroxyethyl bacteriochlorophyllide A dehydrogenase